MTHLAPWPLGKFIIQNIPKVLYSKEDFIIFLKKKKQTNPPTKKPLIYHIPYCGGGVLCVISFSLTSSYKVNKPIQFLSERIICELYERMCYIVLAPNENIWEITYRDYIVQWE